MSHHLVAFIFLLGTLASTACAGVGPKDAVVLMIRHAEKPDHGVGLAPRGEQRAQAYPGYFCPFKGDAKPLRLDAIFATADSASSQRSNLTIAPLANAMGIPVNTRYSNKEIDELANELRATQQGKNLLVCWHHGQIPDLLRALGAKPKTLLPNGEWPSQVFDWVIQLKFDHEGRVIHEETRRISEHLLPGDST
ncbi:MAG: flagellar basal body-associated protein FliL [Verrucomicrobiota bacterium]